MIEIERKFLVSSDAFIQEATHSEFMEQGFLSTDPERTVRIRILGQNGILTVKGASSQDGTTRTEWEQEVPLADAKLLMQLCLPGIITKKRYYVPKGELLFEVDVFGGDNLGLIVAEVELQSADQIFNKPSWLCEEVTGDVKYYNSQLSKKPFNQWLDTSFLSDS